MLMLATNFFKIITQANTFILDFIKFHVLNTFYKNKGKLFAISFKCTYLHARDEYGNAPIIIVFRNLFVF